LGSTTLNVGGTSEQSKQIESARFVTSVASMTGVRHQAIVC
jgi:hypothetical protein